MAAIFTLPDAVEDDNICIMDKYQFKDRKLETDDHSGQLMARILCTFHACTVEYTKPKVSALVGDSNDLSKSSTKPVEPGTSEAAGAAKTSTKSAKPKA